MNHPLPEFQADAYIALRVDAHAELFEKLSKLRAFLGVLRYGSESFYAMDEAYRNEYLGTCAQYADDAFLALTVWDGGVK